MTYQKLTPQAMVLWTQALESGEYKQGTGELHNVQTERWCCLGVLCDIAVKQGVKVERVTNDSNHESFDGETGGLPSSVARWATGNQDFQPSVWFKTEDVLVAMNDGDGAPFPEISAWIKENLAPES